MNAEFSEAVERAAWLLKNTLQDRPYRALVVCGAARSTGSSSTTIALARHLRRSHGMDPLVLELKAHGRGLARDLQLDAGLSVEGIAAGDSRPRDCVQRDSAGVAVIVSSAGRRTGAAPPLDGLVRAIREIVADLGIEHDLILVDVPPAASVESLAAVSVVPHVLLVAEYGRTQQDTLTRVRKELSQAGATIVGTILTKERRIIPRWLDRWLGA